MISICGVTVSYEDKAVLQNWSHEFALGQIHAVMGPSGCGKTTLLRTIAGLIRPNHGCVKYEDKEVKGPSRDICMMHQTYANFPWKNCIDNILFPMQIIGKLTSDDFTKAKTLLEQVGLGNYALRYPDELSGGMKQRLALARVLMSLPKVILMDEPLSALDPVTRQAMQNLIIEVHKQTKNTIILVTHSRDEAIRMGDTLINFKE